MILAFSLWAVAFVQAVVSIWSGVQFRRAVLRSLSQGGGNGTYQPPATIILPCCGIDNRLRETVDALRRQSYSEYDVIFVFESTADPAYGVVGQWTADWGPLRCRRVVAGRAERRSQKVHNLLAAVAQVAGDRQVLAFLDSDAVPRPRWLADLVAPLSDETVGAASGFRWYSAEGSFVNGIRSAWNAATVSYLHDDRLNFCWGGSTAIRRSTFESCRVAARWQGALSDDYQVTRAVRDAGLKVRFVPQCLIPCHEPTDFRSFWGFARRQLIITRVCAPSLWKAGLLLAMSFNIGALAMFVGMVATAVDGAYGWAAVCGGVWLLLLLMAKTKNALRQDAVSRVLTSPDWTWRDWAHDVLGCELLGMIHLALLLSSARSRRVVWRNTEYEMVSADETRVIPRVEADAPLGVPRASTL